MPLALADLANEMKANLQRRRRHQSPNYSSVPDKTFTYQVKFYQRNMTGGGGTVAQSVERATPGEEVPGSIPAVAACSLLVGTVSV